ncbi:hypothetical protein FBY36_4074 [Arthrobacter sp. SLBN-122]|nr:hypothetical protein FBY36_4074 [Arthrobacter sp. SLBN-122]
MCTSGSAASPNVMASAYLRQVGPSPERMRRGPAKRGTPGANNRSARFHIQMDAMRILASLPRPVSTTRPTAFEQIQ